MSLRGPKASHEVEFRVFEAPKRLMESRGFVGCVMCVVVCVCVWVVRGFWFVCHDFLSRLSRLLKAPITTASHAV